MASLPAGWKQSTDPNKPATYNYTFKNQKRVLSDGTSINTEIVVEADKSTGNYTVFQNSAAFGKTTLYTYDAKTNKADIEDAVGYTQYFSGALGNTFKDTLDKDIRSGVFKISEATKVESGAENNDHQDLKNSDGYKSLANTETQEQQTKENGVDEDLEFKKEIDVATVGGVRGALYNYPLELPPDLNYDFIQITAFDYVPAGLDIIDELQDAESRIVEKQVEDALETVVLPMQPNLSESRSVDWGGDRLDVLQGIGANLAGGLIQGIAGLNFDQFKGAFSGAFSDLQGAARDPQAKAFAAAYFAGQAVGANVTGRVTGSVINPNLELLFNGPRLRTFNFNFKLTPRSELEAIRVKEIITSFKRNMSPQRSSSNLFLLTPRVFKIKYIYGGPDGEQHPYLNKIKPCAMTSFNVNYTPDNTYMTYANGGSMTSYEISMSFGELEPIYADEYTNGNNGPDMGY